MLKGALRTKRIHAKQVATVLTRFGPDAAEVAWARRMLDSGDGSTGAEGDMIDEPVRLRARVILARSAQAISTTQRSTGMYLPGVRPRAIKGLFL